MGLWYILEYQYPKEMGLADLSCLTSLNKRVQERDDWDDPLKGRLEERDD